MAWLLIIAILIIFAVTTVALLSRHKKSGTEPITLTGLTAVVITTLDPEGTILVRGEIWPARTHDGTALASNASVKVVGAIGHLLLVTGTFN